MSESNPAFHDSRKLIARILFIAITVVLGLLTKIYTGPFAEPVRETAGGFFYVIFFVLVFSLVFPKAKPFFVVLGIVLATCGIEFLQLYDAPVLTNLRASRVGRLFLGTSFSWWDFPPYFAGGCAGYFLLRRFQI